jgi:hypothetical protein
MEDVDVGRQDGVGVSHRVCNKDNNILLGQVIVAQVIQWGYRYPKISSLFVQPPFFYIEYTLKIHVRARVHTYI